MSEEINNSHQQDLASEPAFASALEKDVFEADNSLDCNFNDVDFGYAKTIEELNAALDEADSERNDPAKWITPVEFHTRLETLWT